MKERARKKQLHKRIGWRLVWQVIEQVACGKWTETTAGRYLKVARSRVNELKRRWLAWRGREPSPDWLYAREHTGRGVLPEPVRAYVEEEIRYYMQESPFFRGHINFAFMAQQCRQRYGIRVHRNTIRRWAAAQGLYDPKTLVKGKPYVRFEKGGIGMLFQHDSSIHAWLPYTGRRDTLIMTEDDHSRKVVGALLVPHDTSWHHLCVARATMETHGRPVSYYVDNHLIFHHPEEVDTQFTRALRSVEVDVTFTAKKYPEAKGKIEKRFDYFQRRLPLLCERYKTKSLTEANKILADEVAYYNDYHIHDETEETPGKRWSRALQEGRSYLRELPAHGKLDIIFALHYRRRVDKCGQVWFQDRPYAAPGTTWGGHATLVLRPPTGPRRPHTEIYILNEFGEEAANHVIPSNGKPARDEGPDAGAVAAV